MIDKITSGIFSTNTYILYTGKWSCVLIDPGGDTDEIAAFIKAKNLKFEGIALTHGHQDHTSAIDNLLKTAGGGVKVAIHERDRDYLGEKSMRTNMSCFAAMGIEGVETLAESFFTVASEPDIFLKEGDSLFGTKYTVIETPGHTGGSVCFYNREEKILFSGDTLFFQGVGRTDLPGGNYELLKKSIKERLFALPDDTLVYPGHGPFTYIGEEKNNNPFI